MTPQIESTKAVGLVFLPGAMTGLLLAGVEPSRAVVAQLAIMYLILGSVVVSSADEQAAIPIAAATRAAQAARAVPNDRTVRCEVVDIGSRRWVTTRQ